MAALLLDVAVVVGRREPRPAPLSATRPERRRPRMGLAAGGCRPWWSGALLGGPAFAAGLLAGDLGRRRIGDAGRSAPCSWRLAAVAAGLVAGQPPGLPPAWCDALAGAGIGLAAAVLLTRTVPARTDDTVHG